MTHGETPFSDETLTAYLDDELDADTRSAVEIALAQDAALTARLAALDIPLDVLRQVMEPAVLRAPAMPDLPVFATPAAPQTSPRRGRMLMPLTLAATFALGMVATTLLIPAPAAQSGWLNAIASYQALYVTETLSGARQQDGLSQEVLARAGNTFGVPLDTATTLSGLDFRRAQMLGFKGKPLLQMAYLTNDGVPMALCLIKVSEADRGVQPTTLFELAGASWVNNGVGYFLIGGQDSAQIAALSRELNAKLSS